MISRNVGDLKSTRAGKSRVLINSGIGLYLCISFDLRKATLFGKNWLISVSDQTIVDLLRNRANAVAEKQPIPGFLR